MITEEKNIMDTIKMEYVTFIRNWRIEYKALSENIRYVKTTRKPYINGMTNPIYDSSNQSKLHQLSTKATTMMETRTIKKMLFKNSMKELANLFNHFLVT